MRRKLHEKLSMRGLELSFPVCHARLSCGVTVQRHRSFAVRRAGIARHGGPMLRPIKILRRAHAARQAECGVVESVLEGLFGQSGGQSGVSGITKQSYASFSSRRPKRLNGRR